MSNQGYYRFPAIHGESVYFVAEDDIWRVERTGGKPVRMTAGLGEMGKMSVSPDGRWLAVTAREEKHTEVYTAPAGGGQLRRLTYLGAECGVRGFTPEGEILFVSNAGQPFARMFQPYKIHPDGGRPEPIPVGMANDLGFGPGGRKVIGRNTSDPARWKRYRGGTAGKLWIDAEGAGEFQPLLPELKGNLASPMWVGDRIYFLSDHEGIGNLFSCDVHGGALQRHTNQREYFARWTASDGRRIVYQCGGSLFVFDPRTEEDRQTNVEWHGPGTQTQRRFIAAERFFEYFSVNPEGHSVAVECRGKPIAFGLWEGATRQYGLPDGVRYRMPQWIHDGKSLAVISDASGEEHLEVFEEDGASRSFDTLDLGRVVTMTPSPAGPQIALSNHRLELLLVDTATGSMRKLDSCPYRRIEQVAWSPDGAWLAYDFATSPETSAIKLCEVSTGHAFLATTPEFRDFAPAFDPDGKYLYFLSHRVLDPVYDSVYFDLNFPQSAKPCLVVLSKDDPSPFVPKPRGFGKPDAPRTPPAESKAVRIDAEGIERRILAFPVPEGIYRQIAGLPGRALFTSFPIMGALNADRGDRYRAGTLHSFDFETQESEAVLNDVGWFEISADRKTLVYRVDNRLRAVSAAEKLKKAETDKPSRKSGWLDLSRLRVSVAPRLEWKQMFRDVWRLQREYFWVENMSGVEWDRVYDRYAPLVDRVATRAEFSDLVWEMQGELGTSHAYESGGDHRRPPEWPLGLLAADFTYDAEAGCYRIAHIVKGDPWTPDNNSPLDAPGLGLKNGDRLIAVRGRLLTDDAPPQMALVHQAGVPVELTVAEADGSNVRRVTVTTLRTETPARYREWVERNRHIVHERTGGRCGYVHIPDMGPRGYSEFHRYYNVEAERECLIVDVRYNGGGHVSPLILEKLGRKRIGYDFPRWGAPEPYPPQSVLGSMVAICNEHAGSDGDMFCHAFKLMELGTLVGKRTWGGVIGISPRHRLSDGSVTTQPEYSFWFKDVEWGVENYGTDPHIEVDVAPQDYAAGRDPQMEKAIELILEAMKANPAAVPNPAVRPHLPLP